MVNLNDVLLAMSNIPVDDPIAEIWGRQLQGGYKTIEYTGTLPITINANGEALIDYCIYGNTVQNGTPTPENPIMPIGCGERTENLADFIAPSYSYEGFYAVATLAQAQEKPNCILLDTGDYAIYANLTSDIWNIKAFTETGEVISDNRFSGESLIPHPSSQYWFKLTWRASGSGFWYFVNKIDLSIGVVIHLKQPTWILICSDVSKATHFSITPGSTAPDHYIPYGYKLPILSNSTVTNIYLGEAETTRRIKKLVLTGDEYFWSGLYWANAYVLYGSPSDTRPAPVSDIGICSHFVQQSTNTLSSGHFNIRYTTQVVIGFGKSDFSTLDDFKSYLAAQYAAGNPVTIWYVLAEPEIGIVNEPLMKIGDYADTIDSTQTTVQIPTIKGETTIDYDGTPKPSQVYIKYKGKE